MNAHGRFQNIIIKFHIKNKSIKVEETKTKKGSSYFFNEDKQIIKRLMKIFLKAFGRTTAEQIKH